MTQPTFSPVPALGEVRPTMTTQTPEVGRTPKVGLQRSARPLVGAGFGTPAPGEGFALTIAHHECAKLDLARSDDRHDVELGVALVAAKRASLVGRGPILSDVLVTLDLFGLGDGALIDHDRVEAFSGLAHSYALQRRFVDSVTSEQLIPGALRSPTSSR